MHHFIYPDKDTYITNRYGLDDKNFGIDELLQVGTLNKPIGITSFTKNYYYDDQIFSGNSVTLFTGTFIGSIAGTFADSSGTISGSILIFSASYFSGSIDGVPVENSGSQSGSLISGIISGSLIFPYVTGIFNGQLTGSRACLTGTGSGYDTRNERNRTTTNAQYVDRALLKFNVTEISESIVNGDIVDPKFFLNVKVCNEYNLPITYTVYAFPISQSWNMGDGYESDGGSDEGTDWIYRDSNGGTPWYTSSIISPKISIDFVSDPSLTTTAFSYGGGTWYSHSFCSQSFSYESSDINMDVTSIVMQWISGTLPNEGIILIQSDELQATGSGFVLRYFSRDTNTIYSPYLDVKWSDFSFSTGSISTGSVNIATGSGAISASIQTGSSIYGGSGISGSFSGSTYLIMSNHYITASNQVFNYSAANSTANDTWYVNNGYHYDSWETAWQLDPYHGGFLPNTDITATSVPDYGSPPVYQFTGSFTGSFIGTASYVDGYMSGSIIEFYVGYFSGSVDGTSSISSGSISGSQVNIYITGSASSANQVGLFIGQMTGSSIYLNGTGSGYYLDTTYYAFSGITSGTGLNGNILGLPVFGPVQGFTTITETLVTGPCGKNFSASLAKAIFTDGPYSGSAFTAYYIDYQFENAVLTGSWNNFILYNSSIYIPIPSGIDPYVYAYVAGTYINGTALGIYTTSGSYSSSFNGQFINGNAIGSYLQLQLSGSIFTSSYAYTSSITLTSSLFNPLDIRRPFSINLQNLQPQYKVGDIIKLDVFGRKKFPLKYFGKTTQQTQYLVPEFLPFSSSYALKDNQTDEIVLDFDDYTRISCEYPNGNYFILDTTGLPQERYFRVLIKVQDSNTSYTIDTGKIFKITR